MSCKAHGRAACKALAILPITDSKEHFDYTTQKRGLPLFLSLEYGQTSGHLIFTSILIFGYPMNRPTSYKKHYRFLNHQFCWSHWEREPFSHHLAQNQWLESCACRS